MTRHIALLRGINVGGNNMLPMSDLAGMFAKAGCSEVITYIQSGNVVFAAEPSVAKRAALSVTEQIAKRFGYSVPVVVRSAQQLDAVIASNPFPNDAEIVHVMFLAADKIDPERTAALEQKPPDSFTVLGREIFLRLPNGVGRSKLTNAYFDSRLDTVSTLRNWRTVLKLSTLVRG